MRSLLARILGRAGFRVVTANNGVEALERCREGQIDVVITDMVMPVMDGIELIRALAVERPAIQIIAISGVHDWSNYLGMAIKLGAKAGIQKPVGATDLVEAVRKLVPASP